MPQARPVIDTTEHPIQYILRRAKAIAHFIDRALTFNELATALVPGTPIAGRGVLYLKDDGGLYFKGDDGTEINISMNIGVDIAAKFDGDGSNVFTLPEDDTDPTTGGGAATGRIPVSIGGGTHWIAYY
jgi:hypothetical protein